MQHEDIRRTRIFDLAETEVVSIRCQCGRVTEIPPRLWVLNHRVPSDTLIYDLQYRLKCDRCSRKTGFQIAIASRGRIGVSSHSPPERVIVPFPEPPGRPRLSVVPPEPEK
jgi:hypothetical protein